MIRYHVIDGPRRSPSLIPFTVESARKIRLDSQSIHEKTTTMILTRKCAVLLSRENNLPTSEKPRDEWRALLEERRLYKAFGYAARKDELFKTVKTMSTMSSTVVKGGRKGVRGRDSCPNGSVVNPLLDKLPSIPAKIARQENALLVTGQRRFALCLAKRIRGIAIANRLYGIDLVRRIPTKRLRGLFCHFALPNRIAHNSARV